MKKLYWSLLLLFSCSICFGQNQSIKSDQGNLESLNFTFQNAITSRDTIAVFDASTALVAFYNAQAKIDSAYHYQNIQIAYFNGSYEIDHYIEALKNNYFMDRRFGRGQLANSRVKEFIPWMDDPRVSMKNRSDIAFLVAGFHYANGQIEQMLDYQLKSIIYADSIAETNRLQVVNRAQMGLYLQDIGSYADALEFLTAAEPIMEQINYPEILKVQLYNSIAKAMVKVNDINAAEEYAEKMISIIDRNKFSSMGYSKAQIKAEIARGKRNYKEALKYYRQAYQLADQKAKDKPIKRINQMNAATMHLRLNDLSGAKMLLDSIVDLEESNDRIQILNEILWTDYYIKKGDLKNASNYLDLVNSFNSFVNPYEKTIAELNRRFHQKAGNKDQELNYLKAHTRIKDSLDKIANKAVARRLEAEFKREKQKIEIEGLTQTNIEKDKSLAIRNALIWVGGISLLVLGGLLFWLNRLYLKNRENQKQLTAQNKQISETLTTNQLLIKEIHHRVKNNLQVVSSLLSMQARKSVDETTKEALQTSKSRVQSMSILHKALYKNDSPTEVDVNDYFKEIVNNIQDTYGGEFPVDFELDIEHLLFDVDTLVPLGLIVNELITNAYKHAFDNKKGEIYLNFSFDSLAESYSLLVKDNGVGLPGNELPSKEGSLGNRLIKEFARSLGGVLTIVPTEIGTSIKVSFPKDQLNRSGNNELN